MIYYKKSNVKEEFYGKKSKGTDMLSGPLAGKIIIFALPILLTSVAQQLFNSADTAVIGRFGENGAFAAVGTNCEIAALNREPVRMVFHRCKRYDITAHRLGKAA